MIFVLCLWSVNEASFESGNSNKYWKSQGSRSLRVCQTVAKRSLKANINPIETITLSYIETRHNDKLKGSAGELGPIQALPKYWKRKGDKDSLTAGLRAWKYYTHKYKTLEEQAGYYNGSGPKGRYAKKYRKHYDYLNKLFRVLRFPL